MKKLACFAMLCLFVLIHSQAYAQTAIASDTPKIGYTSIDFILGKMPETKIISNELNVTRTQLEKGIDDTIKEFQAKYEAYQKNGSQMTDVIRTDKERELANLQERVQEMRGNAQQALQAKQEQLLSPLITKIETAVKAVGKAQGYLYVFSSEGGQQTPFILFAQSEDNNITPLVLQKLGIDPGQMEASGRPTPGASTPGASTPGAAAPGAAAPGAAAPGQQEKQSKSTSPAATRPATPKQNPR